MTTNYHTAIATGESNAPATINNRLSDLDRAIAARATEITALSTSGVGSVYAQINNASGEGDTSWVIDNISGTFLAGATVVYSVSGVVYSSTVAANTSASPLTVTAAPGVTIPDNTVISQVPAAIVGKFVDGTVNVKDPTFGAVGNGSTDDYDAIAAAIAAVPVGGEVLFPPGTYMIDTTITLSKAIRFRGVASRSGSSAAIIKLSAAQTNMISTTALFEADGIIFDANSNANVGIYADGVLPRLRNCEVKNTDTFAIDTTGSSTGYGELIDCTFTSCVAGPRFIGTRASSEVYVRNMRATNTGTSGTGNLYMLYAHNRVTVEGGVFDTATSGPNIYEVAHATVIGGHYNDTQRGPTFGKNTTYGVITGCVITGCSFSGISIDLRDDGDPPATQEHPEGFHIVSNNVISDCDYGVYWQGKRGSILGNRFEDCTNVYIVRINSGENILIDDNVFLCESTSNNYRAIFIDADSTAQVGPNNQIDSGVGQYVIQNGSGGYFEATGGIQTFTASGDASMTADLLVANCTAGIVDIDLPAYTSGAFVGKRWRVVKTDSSNNLTITCSSGVGTINGTTSYTLAAASQYSMLEIVCIDENGTYIISKMAP